MAGRQPQAGSNGIKRLKACALPSFCAKCENRLRQRDAGGLIGGRHTAWLRRSLNVVFVYYVIIYFNINVITSRLTESCSGVEILINVFHYDPVVASNIKSFNINII